MLYDPELAVQHLCLGDHILQEVLRSDPLHRIRQGIQDYRVLLLTRLFHEIGKPAHLKNAQNHEQEHRHGDRNDIHSENFKSKTVFHGIS